MKIPFSINNDTIALCLVAIVTLIFVAGGICDVLSFPFVLILLLGLTSVIAITVVVVLFQRSIKKNRLQEIPQDDLA